MFRGQTGSVDWRQKRKRKIPKQPPKSILKLREKSNPLGPFIRDNMKARELDFHEVYLVESALDKAFRYKSLSPKGIEKLHKIKASLQRYAVSVIRNRKADERDIKAAKRAEELIAKINNFNRI